MQLLRRALDLRVLCLLRQARWGMGTEVPAILRVRRLLPSLEQGPILAQACCPHHLQDQQRQVGFVQMPVPALELGRKRLEVRPIPLHHLHPRTLPRPPSLLRQLLVPFRVQTLIHGVTSIHRLEQDIPLRIRLPTLTLIPARSHAHP